MYQVAASWAFKPAEYNLGVMYLNGQGTPVDLPRALAWMALAAERNDPQYVKARNLINGHLTDAQFKQANVILAQLAPTYSDKVALARAKARWSEVRASATGSHVGSTTGPLVVSSNNDPSHMGSPHLTGSVGALFSGNALNGGITRVVMPPTSNCTPATTRTTRNSNGYRVPPESSPSSH